MRHPSRFLSLLVLPALLAGCQDRDPAALGGPSLDPAIQPAALSPTAALGQLLFEDVNLSVNRSQSCRTCHEPSEGFAAPVSGIVTQGSVVQGSVTGRFGDRKPPTAAYATLTPVFSGGNNPTGGLFWDGRATGQVLGTPAGDQAMGPFVNPAEQALPDIACVVYRVKTGTYLAAYTAVWGTAINAIVFPSNTATICSTPATTAGTLVGLTPSNRTAATIQYGNIARSVAAFEASLNRFSAKVDVGGMTAQELQGQKLFSGRGKCQQCHANKATQAPFTDFNFHNLGVPKNPANPKYPLNTTAFDQGLGGFTGRAAHIGKFRTPTTRNVGAGTHRSYMHNGVFTSLRQVVDFYNTRDAVRTCTAAELAILSPSQYGTLPGAAGCWPPPEYPIGMDTKQMGKLGLTLQEVDAIVAYLRAMTDQ
ncbi:MAG TPA: cytochrome c peroxidase [Gemmatimonadales bacterium]|nr:cytochrome c peroxidase [Gemmatimonadales bacterium]